MGTLSGTAVARVLVAAAVVAGLYVAPASAHGPCGICLKPASGPPGTKVRISHTSAYWVIWNGRGLPQDGALRPLHRGNARTIELVRCRQAPPGSDPVLLCPARRDVSFTVPQVASGSYPVVIYDGTESGFHYTFDVFRVTSNAGRGFPLRLALFAGAALLLLAVAYGARRSITQASRSRR
jgi:hypothetical protein